MQSNERYRAKEQLITALLEGRTFQQASFDSQVPVKRAMAYRLLRAVRTQGTIALQDRRHGHPSKLRGEVRVWLETSCRAAPHTPSSVVQTLLQERFGVNVSISQINRVRVVLGVSNLSKPSPHEKKRENQGLLRHSQSGKKGQGAFCYLLLLTRRNFFPAWRRLSPRIFPRLIHRYISFVANRRLCAVCCSLCSFCKRWGFNEPGICVATPARLSHC